MRRVNDDEIWWLRWPGKMFDIPIFLKPNLFGSVYGIIILEYDSVRQQYTGYIYWL